MTAQEKILYTGKTHTTGGREGFARSDDARLEVRLSSPGSDKPGTNPEQLFCRRLVGLFHRRIGACRRAA